MYLQIDKSLQNTAEEKMKMEFSKDWALKQNLRRGRDIKV